jgi:hypothetical protein
VNNLIFFSPPSTAHVQSSGPLFGFGGYINQNGFPSNILSASSSLASSTSSINADLLRYFNNIPSEAMDTTTDDSVSCKSIPPMAEYGVWF